MTVKFHRPHMTDAEMSAVISVLSSGWITAGKITERLEDMVRENVGAKYAVALNSATTGLMLSTQFYEEKLSEDPECSWEVPALSFVALANVVKRIARWVDCGRSLSSNGGYWAECLGLEYGGAPVCAQPDAPWGIIDAAYSLGSAALQGRTWARVYSMQATKPITSTEGGIVTTNDGDFAEWLRRMRYHGLTKTARERAGSIAEYDCVEAGAGSYLLPDLCSAVAVSQMKRIRNSLSRRREIAARYEVGLGEFGESVDHRIPVSSCGLFAIRVPNRMTFREELLWRGVETGNHYPYLPSLTAYNDTSVHCCPVAKQASQEVVTLPIYDGLRDEEVEFVIAQVKECYASQCAGKETKEEA